MSEGLRSTPPGSLHDRALARLIKFPAAQYEGGLAESAVVALIDAEKDIDALTDALTQEALMTAEKWTLPALIAVVEQAARQMHLNDSGVGLGPTGWHVPGECKLCDALRAGDKSATTLSASEVLGRISRLADDNYDGPALRWWAQEALGRPTE